MINNTDTNWFKVRVEGNSVHITHILTKLVYGRNMENQTVSCVNKCVCFFLMKK